VFYFGLQSLSGALSRHHHAPDQPAQPPSTNAPLQQHARGPGVGVPVKVVPNAGAVLLLHKGSGRERERERERTFRLQSDSRRNKGGCAALTSQLNLNPKTLEAE
jgi:hypothetical protein